MKHSLILAAVLVGCHDYALYAIPPEPELDLAPDPVPVVDDTEDAEGVWDDVVHGEVDVEDDDGTVSAPPEDDLDDEIPEIEDDAIEEPELSECVPGYQGRYYNLPSDHPEVIGAMPGLSPGSGPEAHDWHSPAYFSEARVDASLMFGEAWWPVDEGLAGDPAHYAVHWRGWFSLDEAQSVTFFFGTDDDGWVTIDGEVVADQGGLHVMDERCYSVTLEAGLHRVDIYTADREASASGMLFEWEEPIEVMACDEP